MMAAWLILPVVSFWRFAKSMSKLCISALLQPSLRAMTAHPMTGFHRTQGFPCMETMLSKHSYFGKSAPLFLIEADSFRVRDFHPIPLFSEQACVSIRILLSGRACATKAISYVIFNSMCSRFLRIKLRKARFLREAPLKNRNRLLETNVTIALKQPKNFVKSGFVVR